MTEPGVPGPTTPIGSGFLGNQGPRIGRPAPHSANAFFGVISITNKTEATVAFSISASTYQDGRFFDFALKPGGTELYYATYGGPFNSAPSFQVSFDTAERRDVIQLADVKTVYASSRWVPTDPAQGRPYAITADAGFLNVVPLA